MAYQPSENDGIIGDLYTVALPALRTSRECMSMQQAHSSELAERMKGTAVAHATQHYHEVRVTPAELTQALAAFFSFVR